MTYRIIFGHRLLSMVFGLKIYGLRLRIFPRDRKTSLRMLGEAQWLRVPISWFLSGVQGSIEECRV